MQRYKLTIEYDGTGYIGWQKQIGMRSVQGDIETAIAKFCGEPVATVAAGRTDAGVHATAQVIHIDLPNSMDPFKVMQGINFYLFNPGEDAPQQPENRIAILQCEAVSDEFHARFSGKRRYYLYRIVNRRARLGLDANRAWHIVEPLDVAAMREAAKHLIGHHDFSSFRDTQCQAKSPEKTLEDLAIAQNGDQLWITTHSRSFLHHQVRIMVGTLGLVGKGKWQPRDVQKALDARQRSAAGPTAPPEGLYLVKVEY